MKRYVVIETLDQMKAMSDPLRLQILTHLIKEEYTGKQLATLLSISASKIHYHLKELENHGLIEVVRTEEKNGIVQKFFRAVAYDFKISEELLPSVREETLLLQESTINQLRMGISRVYNAPEDSFRIFAEESQKPPFFLGNCEIKAPREEIKTWLLKYRALLDELGEMEMRHLERIKSGEAVDDEEIFFLLSVGFMTNEQLFIADDETLPEGYEMAGGVVVRKKRGEKKSHDEHSKQSSDLA
ncbi:ArsR/SmtB family transcription factor [Brevibacillus sp. H7]|uniref:ArsR/SmtB family transcription factor n=1 Tax=Brevibacillus sp. H7 TaxID=3349138 RepID=UPI00382273A6